MPYCPKCRYEYRAEIEKCPDCDVALVDELSPEKPPVVAQGPVCVAAFLFPVQAEEAKLKLESHSIEARLSGDIVSRTGEFNVGFDEGVKVLVAEEDARRAREILEAD